MIGECCRASDELLQSLLLDLCICSKKVYLHPLVSIVLHIIAADRGYSEAHTLLGDNGFSLLYNWLEGGSKEQKNIQEHLTLFPRDLMLGYEADTRSFIISHLHILLPAVFVMNVVKESDRWQA